MVSYQADQLSTGFHRVFNQFFLTCSSCLLPAWQWPEAVKPSASGGQDHQPKPKSQHQGLQPIPGPTAPEPRTIDYSHSISDHSPRTMDLGPRTIDHRPSTQHPRTPPAPPAPKPPSLLPLTPCSLLLAHTPRPTDQGPQTFMPLQLRRPDPPTSPSPGSRHLIGVLIRN